MRGRTLVGKPEGKESVEWPRRRCAVDIKMVLLRDMEWGDIDWNDASHGKIS
jgi:hypothetical protein